MGYKRISLRGEENLSFVNYTIKSLSFDVDDINDDLYPYYSRCCQELTKLSLGLSFSRKRNKMTITMSQTDFELLVIHMDLWRYTLIRQNRDWRKSIHVY
ncbi:unnamed protein product [Rhizopus stolonifer]